MDAHRKVLNPELQGLVFLLGKHGDNSIIDCVNVFQVVMKETFEPFKVRRWWVDILICLGV